MSASCLQNQGTGSPVVPYLLYCRYRLSPKILAPPDWLPYHNTEVPGSVPTIPRSLNIWEGSLTNFQNTKGSCGRFLPDNIKIGTYRLTTYLSRNIYERLLPYFLGRYRTDTYLYEISAKSAVR